MVEASASPWVFGEGCCSCTTSTAAAARRSCRSWRRSAARTAGAHPYLVSPRHTAYARKILGPDKLLAPEQGVILESTAAGAREIARETLVHYARLPNYVNNWLRDGFTPQDVDSLSDRLVDSLVAWGSLEAVADRVREHLSAGADHVCLQVISAGGMNVQLAEQMASLRELGKLCRAPFAR